MPGLDGVPGRYNDDVATGLELYDLNTDIGEQRNVADQHPEVVQHLTELANAKRQELGDSLTDTIGAANREPGRIISN